MSLDREKGVDQHTPDIVGREGSVASNGVEVVSEDGLEEAAAISGQGNTLVSTVGTGASELLSAITVLAEVSDALGESTAKRLLEGSSIIVGVKLQKYKA